MKNIVLIGMPLSGKTTVSAFLNYELSGFSSVDIDEEIVREEGKTINKIFEKNGEKYFRDIETDTIKKYLNTENLIVSTGGGVVERDENIEILKQIGTIFYLYADIDTLLKRAKGDTTRPLLNSDDKRQRLSELFNRRDKKYRLADFVIDTNNLPPKEIAVRISEEVNRNENN